MKNIKHQKVQIDIENIDQQCMNLSINMKEEDDEVEAMDYAT